MSCPKAYRTWDEGDWIGTKEAKQDFFLEPRDLASLDVKSVGGGVGCGRPSNFYNPEDLRRAAIHKFGEEGFKKKQAARDKRVANKRKREDDADAALAALVAPAGVPVAGAPAADTTKLRKSLLKMAKKALGFTDGGGPKHWRIEVPGVATATFAALCGRPTDAALATFPKAGAYHSHVVEARTLFAVRELPDLVRDFKREGVGIKIDDYVTLKYKPSDMTLSLHGADEIWMSYLWGM